MLRLHCFSQSGNCFKAAFMLRHVGAAWEPVFVDFMNGQSRDPAWRERTNEMGEAPVLELEDGRKLSQSAVILLHLAQQHGKLGGRTQDEKQEVLRWLFFDNHKFTSYFGTYRFMKAFAPTPPDPAVMAFLKARIDTAFGIVDKHLASSKYIAGDAPTVADLSLCGYLFYPPEESGYDARKLYPNMAAWLDRVQAIAGWASPYDVLPGARIAPKW